MARTDKNYHTKRNQLIGIALELFIEKGYEQTTISDLQKAFELTKGGMYHYFSSKEEILDAVIEQALKAGIDEMRSTLESLPEDERLTYLLFRNPSNSLTQKLRQFSSSNKNTIVDYKVREHNRKQAFPIMHEVIMGGANSGLYTCPYPAEVADFCTVLALSVSEGDYSSCEGSHKADALAWTIECWLNPPEKILIEIRRNLHSIFNENGDYND